MLIQKKIIDPCKPVKDTKSGQAKKRILFRKNGHPNQTKN